MRRRSPPLLSPFPGGPGHGQKPGGYPGFRLAGSLPRIHHACADGAGQNQRIAVGWEVGAESCSWEVLVFGVSLTTFDRCPLSLWVSDGLAVPLGLPLVLLTPISTLLCPEKPIFAWPL